MSRARNQHTLKSRSRNLKCLGLAKKNASLAVSQSLSFTIRHPLCTPCERQVINNAEPVIFVGVKE